METATTQSQYVSRQCVTEAEGIGTMLILPEQDSQYFITLSNSSVSLQLSQKLQISLKEIEKTLLSLRD